MTGRAMKIILKLKENGFQGVIAGGAVRDYIMEKECSDIDIATDATPEQVMQIFPDNIPTGKSFGVIRVRMDDEEFEIATFRADNYSDASDGRRPDAVEFCSMKEDSDRRDFKINSMFFDPIENKIYDFNDGQKDIEEKIIRFVGDPQKRINEDKLRMMRGLRFACKFNFDIGRETYEAIKWNSSKILDISKERIKEEFFKILATKNILHGIKLLYQTTLLKYIFNELYLLNEINQPINYHPEGNVLTHSILAADYMSRNTDDIDLIFVALIHDVGKLSTHKEEDGKITFYGHDEEGKKFVENILFDRFKLSLDQIKRMKYLIGKHMVACRGFKTMKKSNQKKICHHEYFNDLLLLHWCDCMASDKDLSDYDYMVQRKKELDKEPILPPKFIDGKVLIEMGLQPGKIFSKIINMMYDMQLENNFKDKGEAIEYLKGHKELWQ